MVIFLTSWGVVGRIVCKETKNHPLLTTSGSRLLLFTHITLYRFPKKYNFPFAKKHLKYKQLLFAEYEAVQPDKQRCQARSVPWTTEPQPPAQLIIKQQKYILVSLPQICELFKVYNLPMVYRMPTEVSQFGQTSAHTTDQ